MLYDSIKEVLDNISKYKIENNCVYNGNILLKYIGEKNIDSLEIVVDEIDKSAFLDCSFNKIKFTEGLKKIEDYTFINCNINELYLPASLENCNFLKQDTGKTNIIFDENPNKTIINSIKSKPNLTLKLYKDYVQEKQNIKDLEEQKHKKLFNELKIKYKEIFNYDLNHIDGISEQQIIFDAERDIIQSYVDKCYNDKITYDIAENILYKLDNLVFNNDIRIAHLKEFLTEIIDKEKEKEELYQKAVALFNKKQYDNAYDIFNQVNDYKDAKKYINKITDKILSNNKLDLENVIYKSQIQDYIKLLDKYQFSKANQVKKVYTDVLEKLNSLLNDYNSIIYNSKTNGVFNKILTDYQLDKIYSCTCNVVTIAKEMNYQIVNKECNKNIDLLCEVLTKVPNLSTDVNAFNKRIQCILKIISYTNNYSIFEDLISTLGVTEEYTYKDLGIVNKKLEYFNIINNYYNAKDMIQKYNEIKDNLIKNKKKQDRNNKMKKILKYLLKCLLGIIAGLLLSIILRFILH